MLTIQYIKHRDIDKVKWDDKINACTNGFIYSHSFFLDAMCEWDALIMGEYEYLMPLPYRKKAGFGYVYTPFFTGQLGITGPGEIADHISRQFISAIPANFSLVDLQFNECNRVSGSPKIKITERVNYVIPLNNSYEAIASGFNKDAKKNIRQAAGFGLSIINNIDIAVVFEFYKKAYAHLNPGITADDYRCFYNACVKALALGKGFVAGIKNPEDELVAAAFFAIDNKRIYYLLGAPSAKGKAMNASHFLINEIIKQYAGNNIIFDFEGSDIPSVANFYKKFGPQKKIYRHIIINRLPFWIRWIKNR